MEWPLKCNQEPWVSHWIEPLKSYVFLDFLFLPHLCVCVCARVVSECLDYPTERAFHLPMWQWLTVRAGTWFSRNRTAFGTLVTPLIVILTGRVSPLPRRQPSLSVKRLTWLRAGGIRIIGRRPVPTIRLSRLPSVATAHWHPHRPQVRPLPRPSVPLIPTDLFRLAFVWHHPFFCWICWSIANYIIIIFFLIESLNWFYFIYLFFYFFSSMDRRTWNFRRTLRDTLHLSPEVASMGIRTLWVRWQGHTCPSKLLNDVFVNKKMKRCGGGVEKVCKWITWHQRIDAIRWKDPLPCEMLTCKEYAERGGGPSLLRVVFFGRSVWPLPLVLV